MPWPPGDSDGVGGVCGEEQSCDEEEREGEETEEVRGEIWEQRYSQPESGGLDGSGEPDSMLE